MLGAIFPGQGSQSPGMGQFLFDNFKIAKLRFEEASDTLHIDFKKLCFTGSEADLQLTANTQPALLIVSVASYDVLIEAIGFNPQASAGHSIGEYAALVTSGAVDFRDAVRAVRTRGEAMQDAVPVGVGAMCAVLGLTDDQVKELCLWAEKESSLKPIEPANFNSPGQVVVSGNKAAIEWMSANFKKEVLKGEVGRAKFIPLKVSAPFHCSLMAPAEKKMRQVLTETKFHNAKIPVIQNFVARAETAAANLRENVIRQVSAPVLWTQCVQEMKNMGLKNLIEVGSGKVLSGLVKKIAGEEMLVWNLNSLDDLKVLENLKSDGKI